MTKYVRYIIARKPIVTNAHNPKSTKLIVVRRIIFNYSNNIPLFCPACMLRYIFKKEISKYIYFNPKVFT